MSDPFSTIETVRQRLADIEMGTYSGSTVVTPGITNIKQAFAHPTANIVMDLPVMVNFTAGPAEYDTTDLGEEYFLETREYPIRLYAKSRGDGIDQEGETFTEALIEPIRDCFMGRPSLSLGVPGTSLPGVLQSKFIKDSGVAVLSYAGKDYLGAEFSLAVTQVIRRQYAPGE